MIYQISMSQLLFTILYYHKFIGRESSLLFFVSGQLKYSVAAFANRDM